VGLRALFWTVKERRELRKGRSTSFLAFAIPWFFGHGLLANLFIFVALLMIESCGVGNFQWEAKGDLQLGDLCHTSFAFPFPLDCLPLSILSVRIRGEVLSLPLPSFRYPNSHQ